MGDIGNGLRQFHIALAEPELFGAEPAQLLVDIGSQLAHMFVAAGYGDKRIGIFRKLFGKLGDDLPCRFFHKIYFHAHCR